MALNLIQSSKVAMEKGRIFQATIMELYAKNSMFLSVIPFETIPGNAISFRRELTLPDTDFRGINEAYSESTGDIELVTESLAIAGGDIDVDKFLVDTNGEDQRTIQEGLKIKSLALKMTKNMIKGSIETNAKGFNGLQVRLKDECLIIIGTTPAGDALTLAKLEEAIDVVEDPTHLIMNKAMRRRLTAASRETAVGGYITFTQDQFGRRVTQFNELPIIIVFRDEANAEILAFDELGYGSSDNHSTSIYVASFADNGVTGLQNGDMNVRDLGEIDTKPVYRTRIDWYISQAIKRPKACARLYGISNAKVTA